MDRIDDKRTRVGNPGGGQASSRTPGGRHATSVRLCKLCGPMPYGSENHRMVTLERQRCPRGLEQATSCRVNRKTPKTEQILISNKLQAANSVGTGKPQAALV
jgi:hypothetical protein